MNNIDDATERKLLLLLPFPPRLDAAHGGSRVLAQLILRLAKRNKVAILYLRAADEPSVDETVCQRCEICEEVERPDYNSTSVGQWMLRLYFFWGFLVGRPMWAVQWQVPAYRQRLDKLMHDWQPDIVQAEFHIMGQYLLHLPQSTTRTVLTEHEPGINSAPYLMGIYPKLAHLIHPLDRISWYRYERNLLSRVTTIVVFTDEDRHSLARYHITTPIVCIPLGTEIPNISSDNISLDKLGETPASLLFVGSFVHGPNIDAAQRLIDAIFPRVCRHVPNACLYIVGNLPPPQLRHAANDQIVVTGFVPDLSSYLELATVVVVPLRLGGGMRVKVLEALAAGKAIVASPLAINGLNIVAGQHLLVAESDDQFCDAIVQLLEDPEQRVALARSARLWAEQNLDWRDSVAAYEAIYNRLLQPSAQQSEKLLIRRSLWEKLLT